MPFSSDGYGLLNVGSLTPKPQCGVAALRHLRAVLEARALRREDDESSGGGGDLARLPVPAHDMKTGYELPHAEVDFREPKVQNPCSAESQKHARVDEQARTPVARILSAKVLTSRRLPIADQEQFNGF